MQEEEAEEEEEDEESDDQVMRIAQRELAQLLLCRYHVKLSVGGIT